MKNISTVDNPLTIIAIFAGITEIAASSVLPFADKEIQSTFIWFLIIFPFFLITLFFVTLNFNPKVLYAPKDYKDEKNFIEALQLSRRSPEVTVTSDSEIIPSLPSEVDPELPSIFGEYEKGEIDAFNAMFAAFSKKTHSLFEDDLITTFGGGIVGDHLFKIVITYKAGMGPGVEIEIVRTERKPDERIKFTAVGQEIESDSAEDFADKLFRLMSSQVKRNTKKRPNKAREATA